MITMTEKGEWKNYYNFLKHINNFLIYIMLFIWGISGPIGLSSEFFPKIINYSFLWTLMFIICVTAFILFLLTEFKLKKLDKIQELKKHGTINEDDFQRLMNKYCKLLK